VTGAASGIGAASAARLAEEGARLVLIDTNRGGLERVAASLGADALAVPADVSREEDVDGYVGAALERFGRIDLHHLNAGISGTLARLPEVSVAEFDEVIGVNLRGAFLGLRAAFRQFERQGGGGSIVVTASIASLRGSADLVPYHASKHGVVGLARCAAVHGGSLGVRVNAIAPGIVPTGLLTRAREEVGGSGDATERAAVVPLRRAGTVEEVAGLVAFLLSEEATYLTGEVVSLDGGAAALNPLRPSYG
jgi:NAD(P)-dependent dehydrogenase (short-subunit alcohol dehydrogenase family)